MNTRCTVCTSPKRGEVEAAIRSGAPLRHVARRFALSRSALDRHVSNGHAVTALALSGDVEMIQDVPYFRDNIGLVGALKEASLSSFNMMRRRGDDPVAIAYLKEIRALVALELDLEDRRKGRDDSALAGTRDRIAGEVAAHRTAVEEARVLDAVKARLEARIAEVKAHASAPVIEATPAPRPRSRTIKTAPQVAPVRSRTRSIVENS
ncbi:hypothetical protein DFI02_1352 [Rhizobium sp. PP-F2F-G20b]|nr:hypothetical protein DFI02_1352 [Rhizobium sp. PP-F2F-G20b]